MAGMTRKDFVSLANVLKQHKERGLPSSVHRQLSHDIASVCAGANANFDRGSFLDAAGVED